MESGAFNKLFSQLTEYKENMDTNQNCDKKFDNDIIELYRDIMDYQDNISNNGKINDDDNNDNIKEISCKKCTFVFNNYSKNCPMCGNEYIDLVEENYIKAYQEIPHTFIKQEMIFLKGYINGHEIKFLVDSGAAISVIPQNFIDACGLGDIIDRSYKGKLLGVGSANIVGRIHYVELILPNGVYPCGFTVSSNNNLEPILGIDMMYNLGMSIDFKNRKLKFLDNSEIRF